MLSATVPLEPLFTTQLDNQLSTPMNERKALGIKKQDQHSTWMHERLQMQTCNKPRNFCPLFSRVINSRIFDCLFQLILVLRKDFYLQNMETKNYQECSRKNILILVSHTQLILHSS